ncbi:MAG: adenine deaminase [Methanobacterium sp.]|nr:adenine deaminase [Methanobacterium sp.]
MKIKGNLLNIFTEEIYPAEISVENGLIKCVKTVPDEFKDLILPGFIDAHIHIESSMLTPSRFAEAVIPHGTTAVVADPHEIANVMGPAGIDYMMRDAATVPLKVYFTAPSCVPATAFETSGAIIDSEEIDRLLEMKGVVALGEMMNFPGVLADDEEVLAKIAAAKMHQKPVDGHAPLLSGDDLCKYISAGISTDHECTLKEEVLEKRKLGMKVMLRQGSSAKNLKDLIGAGGEFIVSDDKHPEDLLKGHVDMMLKEAIEYGLDPIEAVKMVTINPATHYNLNNGFIGPGRAADMVVVDDLEKLQVKKVMINGEVVARDNKVLFSVKPLELGTTFKLEPKRPEDFEIPSKNEYEKVRVIEVNEGQLITGKSEAELKVVDKNIIPDLTDDILKISVVERHGHNRISNGFVHGFSLKEGAIASSVAHDSHNIIVVGTNTQDMVDVVNRLVENDGGLVALSDEGFNSLKLPVAGLMSYESAEEVSVNLKSLLEKVKGMGCALESPFMTLSFMALLVIPQLKISDLGLFDGEKFQFVDLVKK